MDPTFIKPGSRFGGTFFSHVNISSHVVEMFFLIIVYRISSNNRPRYLLNSETVLIRKMKNIKCQNLAIFAFKIRMKHKFSLSINQM